MRDDERLHLDAPLWVHFVFVTAMIATAAAGSFIAFGGAVTTVVVGSAGVGALGWRLTSYRWGPRRSSFPWYVACATAVLALAGVQWATGFHELVQAARPAWFAPPALWNERVFLSVFAFGALAVFLAGAVGAYLLHPLGGFMTWWLCVWALTVGFVHVWMGLDQAAEGAGLHTVAAVLPVALSLGTLRHVLSTRPANRPRELA